MKTFEVVTYDDNWATRSSLLEVEPYDEAARELVAAGATPTGALQILPDNTAEWGPFFCIRPLWAPLDKAWHISWATGVEIEAPWRRGVGIALRFRQWSRVYGIWWLGSAPEMPTIEENDIVTMNTPPGQLL